MLKRMPTHCGDETCASCVVASDFIYLAHHAGGSTKQGIAHQMRATFESVKNTLNQAGASLNDMVQINLYLKDLADFDEAREVFFEYFEKDFTDAGDILRDSCKVLKPGPCMLRQFDFNVVHPASFAYR